MLCHVMYKTSKQLEMLEMEMKGKEAFLENSERWSWDDVARQTVPEAASSHRKRTIANSGQPCTSDH